MVRFQQFGRETVFIDVDLIPFAAQKIAGTLDRLGAGPEDLALTEDATSTLDRDWRILRVREEARGKI